MKTSMLAVLSVAGAITLGAIVASDWAPFWG